MMKKIIAAALLVLGFATGLNVVMIQSAVAKSELDDDICQDPDVSNELKEIAGCNTTQRADTVANNIIKIVSGLLGLLAVVVMIYGGFTFLTSTGDASKVAKGKKIILYGVIGLIVSLMAFAIVSFVGGVVGR